MKTAHHLILTTFVLAAFNLSGATLYVSLESSNPTSPYTNWATAAHVIQDAVDASKDGDTVLVTNGIYATASRDVFVLDANHEPPDLVSMGLTRVVLTNSIRLESVNGPLVTTIVGGELTNEFGELTNSLRCVFMEANAALSGFTLTSGGGYWHRLGGGVFCQGSAVLSNCVLIGNSAAFGGGVSGGTLYDCTVTRNLALSAMGKAGGRGGGAYGSTLYRCTVTNNSSQHGSELGGSGGGVASCILYDCALSGNFADHGGGASSSTLHACRLTGNEAGSGIAQGSPGGGGGGAQASTLYNCIVTGNWSPLGGGTTSSSLYNCVVAGNSADEAGGVWLGLVYNCIVHSNSATNFANYLSETVDHSCTTPLPTNGVGNIDADPRFVKAAAGDFRLRPDSPCIDAGTNLSDIITADISGEFRPWDGNRDGVAAFDIGAYEFRPSPVTLYVSLQSTNPTPPYITWATAATNIQDAVDAAKNGDTVLVTNGIYATGSRDQLESSGLSRVVVTNSIRLESVNGPLATAIMGDRVGSDAPFGTNRCVFLGNHAVLSGFTLTNGYAHWDGGGGVFCQDYAVITNCVLIGNSARVGGGVFGGTLYDCTVSRNSAHHSVFAVVGGHGGGAYDSTLYRCTVNGNSSEGGIDIAGDGGGVYGGILYDCALSGNLAVDGSGGGASYSTPYNSTLSANYPGGAIESDLYNCTVTGNGYGVGGCALVNSIVFGNTNGANSFSSTLIYCCTTPLPANGVGNIDADPKFVNGDAGDLRLLPDSRCIDAGMNLLGFSGGTFTNVLGEVRVVAYNYDPTDILGKTRFIDGNGDGAVAWDIGAYEFNSFKPPRFTAPPRRTIDGWTLNITGEPNKWTRVQKSGNLKDWGDIWLGFMPADGLKQLTDTEISQVMFYRAVVP